MVVYESIEEIPYNVLRNGGTFDVRTESLPSGMFKKNGAMGVVSKSPSILIMMLYLIVGTICTVVIINHIGSLVSRIKAIPEGRVVDEVNGDKIWNSADGSAWILGGDGTAKQIGGSVAMDWNLVIYGVIFMAIIILAWRFLPTIIRKRKKIKLEAVSTYQALKGKGKKR